MSLFRREHRSGWSGEPIVSPFPGMQLFGGGSPSMDQAMQVSAVWACVRLLAMTVSMMPLHAFTKADGIRVPINDPALLISPSAGTSMQDFIYMVMTSLCLRGNAYGKYVAWTADGYPAQIELISADDMHVNFDKRTGIVTYTVHGVVIPNAKIWHVKAFRMAGSPVGLSPIKYAASQINTDSAINSFSLGYFTDAPHPPSVLTSDAPINDTVARMIKDRIKSLIGREPLVLGAGLKFTPLSVSPEESQFLATQKLGTAGIARIYGVPPEMIAAEAGNSLTYSNIESKGVDFLVYSVQWWLTLLESALFPCLPGKKHVRFDTSVLLRSDLGTMIKAGAMAIASKQMTPDEVREWYDKGPLTDAQKLWMEIIPLTVSPSGMPKAIPPAPPPVPPEDALPVDDPADTQGEQP